MKPRRYKVRRKNIPQFVTTRESLEQKLGESYRLRLRILELAWIDGMTSTAIAERLGMKPAAVRMVLLRARREFWSHSFVTY
jgi:hypothetical protein